MSDRPTLKAVDDVDREFAEADLRVLVRRVAHLMHPEAMMADPLEHTHGEPCRSDRLALLSATEALRAALEREAAKVARCLGQDATAPVTYADLGRAVGIGREGARSHWPGAIPDPKPGRPKRQVTVTFQGGPAEWDRYEMQYPASTLEGDLDTVGAYLVVDAVPEGVPANARAHYAPESEDTRTVWTFQGWVPA